MDESRIMLAHGNGGELMQKLIGKLILSYFGNPVLKQLDDAAVVALKAQGKKLAFSTDSFVVDPIFFPGGDIGKLAVCGTVNDLSMMGAEPLFLSVAMIIEEGFEMESLKKILRSMRTALQLAKVTVVCGDTKVVPKGGCDKIFINTSGIGLLDAKLNIGSAQARPADAIIVSGNIGEHGIAILSQREGIEFKTRLKSDCAVLNGLVKDMLLYNKQAVHVLRDPTRGGMAAVLNEIALQSNAGIEIEEEKIPVSTPVRGACEILGLDPLYLPCEGRLLAFVRADNAEKLLRIMRKNPNGKDAAIIGRVVSGHKKEVYLKTLSGSLRIVDMPVFDQMPRIC